MSDVSISKRCSKCNRILPIEKFNKCSKSKDGHRNKCRDCRTKEQRIYRKTGQGKEARFRENQRYRNAKRDAKNAHDAVYYAIKTGTLKHPTSCRCKYCYRKAIHYHHFDYSKKLNVIPVCRKCHIFIHAN
jgi:hypothetical protein